MAPLGVRIIGDVVGDVLEGGSGRWAAPAVASLPGAPGARLALLPPGLGAQAHPEWAVSRVLFRPSVARKPARIIHLGGALLRRSSALTRTLASRVSRRGCFGRVTLDSVPIRACSGRGLPRRRSPGCRAWALTPRFQPCLCLPSDSSQSPSFNGHRRCGFCCAFPRVAPGRR